MTSFARRNFLRGSLAGSLTLFGGCSGLSVLNAIVPTDTFRRSADLAYGSHDRHVLDIYQPADKPGRAPVVVFFYGGNWNSGKRGDYLFVGEALASAGMVAVVPDYRLYPEVRFPDFLHDCARAVAWTADHVGDYSGDPGKIFLMGHSAGAYNAAMLALDPQYLRTARVDPRRIGGLIGLAGPYDFLPLTGTITKAVFGYPDTPISTQPIHHVTKDDPPALLVTGNNDAVVEPGNSARLAARLRANGVTVHEQTYRDVSHIRLVGALAAPLRKSAPVLGDVSAFVQRYSA